MNKFCTALPTHVEYAGMDIVCFQLCLCSKVVCADTLIICPKTKDTLIISTIVKFLYH